MAKTLSRSSLFEILKYLGHDMDSPPVIRLLETYQGEWVESNQLPLSIASRLGDIRKELIKENECEFCGDPADKIEVLDRYVYVCNQCSAEA